MGGRAGKMLVGPGRPYDLIIVCLLAVGAVLLSFYIPSSPLTWALGFLAVFFAPGYAIVSALFPGNREILAQSFVTRREERAFTISLLERIALSFGLSAMAVALAGTLLARGLFGLTNLTVALVVVAITGLVSVIAAVRRSDLPPGDQFAVFSRSGLQNARKGLSRGEKGISAVIVIALIVLAGVAVNSMTARPSDSEGFTEFYISSQYGNMQQLPTTLSVSQEAYVRVTVDSHLRERADMRVVISLTPGATSGRDYGTGGVSLSEGPMAVEFSLGPENQWSQLIRFSIGAAGSYTVYLMLDDGNEVKTLWMPITVTGGGGGGGDED